jgi:antibiotic biosynthesis monooxygenase (ABM) superfamily enzyme
MPKPTAYQAVMIALVILVASLAGFLLSYAIWATGGLTWPSTQTVSTFTLVALCVWVVLPFAERLVDRLDRWRERRLRKR